MTDELRLKKIAHLVGVIFLHGNFKALTANEQELEKLLIEGGYRYRSAEEGLAAEGMSIAEAERWWGYAAKTRELPKFHTQTSKEWKPVTEQDLEAVHQAVTEQINKTIQHWKKSTALRNAKDISDGYHTFGELYEVRAVLNIALFKKICWRVKFPERGAEAVPEKVVWRSLQHSDGSMFDGMFILGYDKEPGKQITFHYHLDKWNDCDFAETLEKAPEWDGHTPADVLERLKQL